jgi:hypothetical protein
MYETLLTAYRGIYPPFIRHSVSDNPVKLLKKIASSARRQESILRPYDAKATPQWAFHVPHYFNEALDIKLLTRKWNNLEYAAWTQGGNFAFKQGDILCRTDQISPSPVCSLNPARRRKGAPGASGTRFCRPCGVPRAEKPL